MNAIKSKIKNLLKKNKKYLFRVFFRFISIQYPLQTKVICSVRNVRFATFFITIISILCGLPKSFDYYFKVYEGWAFVEPGRWVYSR